MKKILCLLLALALGLSLPACGGVDRRTGYQPGGGRGQIGDVMHTYWFDFTVTDAYSAQEYGGYPVDEGCRFVVASITVTNTFPQTLTMWDTDFALEWKDPDSGDYVYDVPLMAYTDGMFPEEYTLEVAETASYEAVYMVPAVESLDYDVSFLELFENEDGGEERGDTYYVSFTAQER